MNSDQIPNLEDLTARTRKLEKLVEDLDAMVLDAVVSKETAATTSALTSPKEPLYQAVEPWVREHFVHMYIRPGPGVYRWCPQWWRHAEAISRLESLWRMWEVARLNPIGMSGWYRDHLDHHLPILMSSTGPFAQCNLEQHHDQTSLPTHRAPDAWWPQQS